MRYGQNMTIDVKEVARLKNTVAAVKAQIEHHINEHEELVNTLDNWRFYLDNRERKIVFTK
jgi:hypothetical protein